MDYPCTPAPSVSPAAGETTARARFNHAAAFLRSAGLTAVHAAGSLAGAPLVGGADETGGELQGLSLFRSFGSVVNVHPGEFSEEGAGLGAEGSGSVAGATILGSSLMTLRSATLSGRDPASVKQESPPFIPSARGGQDDMSHENLQGLRRPPWVGLRSGLTNITITNILPDRVTIEAVPRCRNEKTYSLLPFDLEDAMKQTPESICCGLMGEGSHLCSKLWGDCRVIHHNRRKKKVPDHRHGGRLLHQRRCQQMRLWGAMSSEGSGPAVTYLQGPAQGQGWQDLQDLGVDLQAPVRQGQGSRGEHPPSGGSQDGGWGRLRPPQICYGHEDPWQGGF
jgi:hypothetical protein